MWHNYTAYGLRVLSEVELPELPVFTGNSGDQLLNYPIVVRLGDVQPAGNRSPMCSRVTESTVVLTWPDVGSFQVKDGEEITVDPVHEADPDAVRLYILGPCLSVLLHQRGWPTLHGGSAHIHEAGCIFLGYSGWGKSTLCAALHDRGYPILSDDVSLVQIEGVSHPTMYPSFPRMKIMPDAASALGHSFEFMKPIRSGLTKRSLTASHFMSRPVNVTQVYVLAKGDELRIDPLSPSESLLEFVTHAYGALALRNVKPAHHFRQYGQLASTIPVKRLTRPWDLSRLNEVVDAVEADMMTLASV